MSVFTKYPEVESVDFAANDNVAQSSAQDSDVAKQLKKNNKLMKKIIKIDEKRATEAAQTQKPGFWGFLKKIGKAIVKAIPKLLNTIASGIVNGIFKVKVAEVKKA